MVSHESDLNLSLVTTYLPLFYIILRATVLWALWNGLILAGSPLSMLCSIIFLCVYFDMHKASRVCNFDTCCMYLAMLGCALLLHTPGVSLTDCSMRKTIFNWVCDSVWASSCTFHVACLFYKRDFLTDDTANDVKLVAWSLMFLVHVHEDCSEHLRPASEWIFRIFAYYISCALLFFGQEFLSFNDKAKHMRLIPHICAHVFYVHIYVTISSILALLALHLRFFLNLPTMYRIEHEYSRTAVDAERGPSFLSHKASSPRLQNAETNAHESDESLLLLLRQAQAAKQA